MGQHSPSPDQALDAIDRFAADVIARRWEAPRPTSAVALRPCANPDCSVEFEPRGPAHKYCTRTCGATARLGVPCAGTCGRLLVGNPKSRPAGERMCHQCRRQAWGLDPDQRITKPYVPQPPRGPIGCAFLACQQTIERPYGRQKYCSRQCRERAKAGTEKVRARWARKNAKRRLAGVAASGSWPRLRAQVLREEPDCWICGDAIDPAIKSPHPMSGTGDHVVPLEGGGALLDRANVRAAHKTCNERRHVQWRRERRAALRAARRAA